MTNQIDQQFIVKLKTLTREVLRDEAKFWNRNDQRYSVLHNRIFSKTNQTAFSGLPEEDRKKFKKYFYIDENGTTPRKDVPFGTSNEEQAFFFDQFRNQVSACTYNFERMDFLKPNFSDQKDEEPDFSEAQNDLMLRGVIYPLIHGIEQREIALVEKKKDATVTTTGTGPVSANPYAGLGDRILVKGVSGEFDQVLTFDQLQEISEEEKEIRRNGSDLSEEQIRQMLKDYVGQRFPGLFLDGNGKIITFLGAEGVSAAAAKDQAGHDLQNRSFGEILNEMKARQGRGMQYDAIIAGNGTLGFTAEEFQVNLGGGESVRLDGMTVSVTQGGGQNAVFFVRDNQGASARMSADFTENRLSGNENLNISIYDNPLDDDPANPKIDLDREDLPMLETPLRPLYKNLQQTGGYRTEPGKSVIVKIPATRKPAELPDLEFPHEERAEQKTQPLTHQEDLPVNPVVITDSYTVNTTGTPGFRRPTAPRTVLPHRTLSSLRTRPKIAAEPATKKPVESPESASAASPARNPIAATARGKRPAQSQTSSSMAPAAKPKSMLPKIALAAGIPVAGIGASILGAAIKIMTSFT